MEAFGTMIVHPAGNIKAGTLLFINLGYWTQMTQDLRLRAG